MSICNSHKKLPSLFNNLGLDILYEVDTAFPVSRVPAEIAIIEKIHGRVSSGAHGTTSFCGIAGFMLS